MIMQKEEAAAAAKLLVTLNSSERISQNMKERGRGAVSCRKRKVGAPSAGVEQRGSRLNFGPKPDWPEPVSFFKQFQLVLDFMAKRIFETRMNAIWRSANTISFD